MADKKTHFTQAIWQITQELQSAGELDQALSASLEIIIQTLDSEAGTIWLLDSDSNRLFPLFNHGPVDISGITIENGQGIAGSVVQSGESVIVADTSEDPHFSRSVDEESGFVTRSIICVPLKNSAETIGCVQIINKLDGTLYDADDLALCEQLAALAAIAIEDKGLQFQPSAEKEVIISLRNGSDADIPFGAPVFLSSGDAVPFDLTTPQAFSAFLGFAVRVADKTPDTYPSGQNSADAQSGVWKSGDVMEILVRGGISVPMANAGTKGGALYIRKSDGKLTTAAGTEGTTVLLENVRVRNTRSGADGCGEVIVSRRNLL